MRRLLTVFAKTFLITRNGRLIQDVHLKNSIETGIEFETVPGCIPVYTEVKACIAVGYRYFHDWQELSADQQAFLIAWHISDTWVNANKDDAEARELDRRSSAK